MGVIESAFSDFTDVTLASEDICGDADVDGDEYDDNFQKLLYSRDFVVSPVSRHFPYSREFVVSPVSRHFPYSRDISPVSRHFWKRLAGLKVGSLEGQKIGRWSECLTEGHKSDYF